MSGASRLNPEDERILRRIRRAERGKGIVGEEESEGEDQVMEDDMHNPPGGAANNDGPPRRVLSSYTIPDPKHCGSSIATPTVQANNFELKPQLITLVQNNCSYGGGPLEDPNQHLSVFLRICNTVKTNGVHPDVYKLLLFPFSLRDKATQWLELFAKESLNDWNEVMSRFLAKFYPPQKIIKLKTEVQTFRQMDGESLYEAWERISNLEATLQALNQTTQALALSTQALIKGQKEHEATIKNIERQVGQLAKQAERPTNVLPSDTIPNPREECKALQLRSGKVVGESSNKEAIKSKEKDIVEKQVEGQDEEKASTSQSSKEAIKPQGKPPSQENHHDDKGNVKPQQENKNEGVKAYVPKLPYPTRIHKGAKDQQFPRFLEIFKKLEINIPLAEALEQMPLYAKFLKELITKKRSWQEKETVILTQECSAIIQKGLPPKLKDPGSFLIPCTIGNMAIDKSLCDLGASINLMSLTMMKRLKSLNPQGCHSNSLTDPSKYQME
ncbi:uncharacterized protein LOC107472329 [Arachis duranensis]|uniref:Uncharacterized protein LOC107472329 n=1 Tax=Arachis duranensis TaxID=130453 RepID=A0A6P4BSX1_ARADU|nr:uncharacterized protein LOC107472329 [Arachis duranensis]